MPVCSCNQQTNQCASCHQHVCPAASLGNLFDFSAHTHVHAPDCTGIRDPNGCSCGKVTVRCNKCRLQVCPGIPIQMTTPDFGHDRVHAMICQNLDLPFQQTGISLPRRDVRDSGKDNETKSVTKCDCRARIEKCRLCGKSVCSAVKTTVDNSDSETHNFRHRDGCSALQRKSTRERQARQQSTRDKMLAEQTEREEKRNAQKRKRQSQDASRVKKKAKTEQIEDEHETEDADNPHEPVKKCRGGKKIPVRRDPQSPKSITKEQIRFLSKFAVERPKCSCTDVTIEPSEILFFNDEEAVDETGLEPTTGLEQAETLVTTLIKPLVDADNLPKKGQACFAFTILEKDGNYMVLKTNSLHANKTEDDEFGFFRPQIRPELPNPELGEARFYIMDSCPECSQVAFTDSIVITSKEDCEALESHPTIMKFFKTPYRRDSARRVLTAHADRFGKPCRILLVTKIQPNELSENTQQEGWSLHHSEMEAFLYARRHGWKIVKIIIDRDCCRVCGAVLGIFETGSDELGVDEPVDVHKRIFFYNEFLEGKANTPENKKEEKKTEKIAQDFEEEFEEMPTATTTTTPMFVANTTNNQGNNVAVPFQSQNNFYEDDDPYARTWMGEDQPLTYGDDEQQQQQQETNDEEMKEEQKTD